uniref:Uncharacterized protein n=1 Tax=Anopheles atroparvus TaxID=41427 RepID=A0A182IW16_ANOAO
MLVLFCDQLGDQLTARVGLVPGKKSGKTVNHSRRKLDNGTTGGSGQGTSGGSGAVPTGSAYVLGAGNGANKEIIQLSSIRFQPIAEIAVAQDGVINVADQVSLRILALENYKPQ